MRRGPEDRAASVSGARCCGWEWLRCRAAAGLPVVPSTYDLAWRWIARSMQRDDTVTEAAMIEAEAAQ
jgi:hypothetical protein